MPRPSNDMGLENSVFQFPLVGGNTDFRGFSGGPFALCVFSLPFYLNVKHGSDFGVPLQYQTVVLRVKEVKQQSLDPRYGIESVNGAELQRDRTGVVRYSDIEARVQFDAVFDPLVQGYITRQVERPHVGTISDEQLVEILNDLSDVVRDISLWATNQLIRAYRHVGREFYIRPVLPDDIFKFNVNWFVEGRPFCGTILMNFAKGLTLARLPHDSGFHNNLQTRLTLRESVPTHLELLQDAQDYLDRGEYRQAVIDSRTALEVYLDQTLEAVFQRDNWSHDKIKKALCLSQKWSSPSLDHIREALKAASINNKLKRGLRETLGVKLGEDGKLWYRWRKAKECREGSAHYGDYVSREVATKAVDTIREIMSRIYEATKDKYASGS